MTSGHPATPVALQRDEGEALWFLGTLTTIKVSGASTGGRLAVIEQLGPKGSGSPLHRHQREDECFYVLEGELTFWTNGRVIDAAAGSFVYGPRGVPHTFAVASPVARFLIVAEPAGFEDFVRALAVPAKALTLPPADVQMPSPDRLAAAAAQFGIDILGPPGIPA